jgi:cytochrome c oxidase subunit 2
VAFSGSMTDAPASAPAASAPPAAAPAKAPAAGAWNKQTAIAQGKQVYDQNCAACHMPDGKGNPQIGAKAIAGGTVPNGPLLAHIQLVLHGKGVMPAWADRLSDADLAAVITYERNAFGNHTGDLVKPEDIKAAR